MILILISGISYAVYQRENEVTFINAKVGDFRVSLTDITATSTYNSITLNYTAGGLNPTTTCKYGINTSYSSSINNATNTNCNITGLSANTTYYYQVCTKNNLNQEACKTGSIATKNSPPTLSAITAIATASTIDLSYTEGGVVSSRTCKYSTTSGSYTTDAKSQTSTRCSITGLKENTTYYYQVCISNNGGSSCKTGSIVTKVAAPTLSAITATGTSSAINLSYKESGTVSKRTCKYSTKNGSYTTDAKSQTSTKCSITGLEENTTYYYQVCVINDSGESCMTGSIVTSLAMSEVNVGDYIRMTPTSTSYTISKSLTGFTSDQVINPSELNYWRVIRKNADESIDVVSDYISSDLVRFDGLTGYRNFVGALNTIAAQYTNSKYVINTRHFGFSDQTEFCTSSNCSGDLSYRNDLDLVCSVYGGSVDQSGSIERCEELVAYRKGGISTESPYWIASRSYNSGGMYVDYDGRVYDYKIFTGSRPGAYIRPILTISSTIQVKGGSGKMGDPYTLRDP